MASSSDWEQLTVAELREALQRHNVEVPNNSRRKADLVSLCSQSIAPSKARAFLATYGVTATGDSIVLEKQGRRASSQASGSRRSKSRSRSSRGSSKSRKEKQAGVTAAGVATRSRTSVSDDVEPSQDILGAADASRIARQQYMHQRRSKRESMPASSSSASMAASDAGTRNGFEVGGSEVQRHASEHAARLQQSRTSSKRGKDVEGIGEVRTFAGDFVLSKNSPLSPHNRKRSGSAEKRKRSSSKEKHKTRSLQSSSRSSIPTPPAAQGDVVSLEPLRGDSALTGPNSRLSQPPLSRADLLEEPALIRPPPLQGPAPPVKLSKYARSSMGVTEASLFAHPNLSNRSRASVPVESFYGSYHPSTSTEGSVGAAPSAPSSYHPLPPRQLPTAEDPLLSGASLSRFGTSALSSHQPSAADSEKSGSSRSLSPPLARAEKLPKHGSSSKRPGKLRSHSHSSSAPVGASGRPRDRSDCMSCSSARAKLVVLLVAVVLYALYKRTALLPDIDVSTIFRGAGSAAVLLVHQWWPMLARAWGDIKFCPSDPLAPRDPDCVQCPDKAVCREGSMKCMARYKRVWQRNTKSWACVKDEEKYERAQEYVNWVGEFLATMQGKAECGEEIRFPFAHTPKLDERARSWLVKEQQQTKQPEGIEQYSYERSLSIVEALDEVVKNVGSCSVEGSGKFGAAGCELVPLLRFYGDPYASPQDFALQTDIVFEELLVPGIQSEKRAHVDILYVDALTDVRDPIKCCLSREPQRMMPVYIATRDKASLGCLLRRFIWRHLLLVGALVVVFPSIYVGMYRYYRRKEAFKALHHLITAHTAIQPIPSGSGATQRGYAMGPKAHELRAMIASSQPSKRARSATLLRVFFLARLVLFLLRMFLPYKIRKLLKIDLTDSISARCAADGDDVEGSEEALPRGAYPQYAHLAAYLSEDRITEICDSLSRTDPFIVRCVLALDMVPFYYSKRVVDTIRVQQGRTLSDTPTASGRPSSADVHQHIQPMVVRV